jgi:hypothetical protein
MATSRIFPLLLLIPALTGCPRSGSPPPDGGKGPSANVEAGRGGKEPPSGAPTAAATPPLLAAVNGAEPAETFRGWPLVVTAAVRMGDGPSMALAVPGSERGRAAFVEVEDDAGRPVAWPFETLNAAREASGESSGSGEVAWVLTPEQTTSIAPGTYRATVVVESAALEGREGGTVSGWKGTVRSRPATVRIGEEPRPLSPALRERKAILVAGYLVLGGDPAGAMTRVEEHLAVDPRSVACLTLKGDLHAAGARWEDALGAYERAIEAFGEKNEGAQAPSVLVRKRDGALEKLGAERP